jgi:hypothetical protein
MKVSAFCYEAGKGWSVETFPALDSERTLVLAFGAAEYFDDPAPIAELYGAYPASTILGCSTAGEIASRRVNDDSISVAVIRLEHTRLVAAATRVESRDASFVAGEYLARQFETDGLRGVLVLADGLNVNGSQLVDGLSYFPSHIPVMGGLAADDERFARTWVLHDGRPRTNMATAVGFYGERFQVSHGARGGWESFGPERIVTRSEGNVLYELDGRPALALYKDYLGELASGLPSTGLLYPLCIRRHHGDTKHLVRTILGVDETSQSMLFAGDLPRGCIAQLMRATFDKLVGGAVEAASLAQAHAHASGPLAALAVSCVGRRLVLGEHVEDETEALLQHLPAGTQQFGFYGYGGISPYSTGSCDLHNQTMMLTLLSER